MPLWTISGTDGSGKSTLLDALDRRAVALGHRTKRVWARPGSTPRFLMAKALARRILGSSLPPPGRSAGRDRLLARPGVRGAWLSMAMLDLAFTYAIETRVWTALGMTVLSDRYVADSRVDLALWFDGSNGFVSRAWKWLERCSAKPDVAILLHLPGDVAGSRCEKKWEPFPDDEETRAKRVAEYEKLALSGSFIVLDANRSSADVLQEASSIVFGQDNRS